MPSRSSGSVICQVILTCIVFALRDFRRWDVPQSVTSLREPGAVAQDNRTQPKRKWPRWVGLALALLILIYSAFGFLVVPWWLERQLPEQAQRHLGWQTQTRDISANPFTLSVTVTGFSATDSAGEVVARAEKFHLNVSFLQLFLAQIGIDEFLLDEPYLRLEIGPEGNLNILADWRNNSPQAADAGQSKGGDSGSGENGPGESSEGSSGAFPLVIENAQITAGKILLRDRRGETTQEFQISPIAFDLSGVATFENSGDAGRYYLSATLGDDQKLIWQGDISLMPFRSSGDFELQNLAADALWHFVGRDTPYDWRQGRIDYKSNYQFSDTEQLQLDDGELSIRNSEVFISATSNDQPALQVDQLEAQGLSFDLSRMRLQVGSISAADWSLLLRRAEDGTLNWAADAEDDGSEGDESDSGSDNDETSFSWQVEQVALESGVLNWRDRALSEPAEIQLDQIELELTDLTGDPDSPVGIALQVTGSDKGTGQLNGEFTLSPFTLESSVQLSDVSLANYQAYLNEAVNLELAAGTLDFDGTVSLDDQKPKLTGSIEGTLSADAVQTQLVELESPFLSWTSLRLNPLRVQLEPLTVDIPEIRWTGPEFTYVRLPDGKNSVSRVTADDEEGETASAETETAGADGDGNDTVGFALRIQRLGLESAAIVIDDRSIEGGFQTRIHNLSGELLALGNQKPQRAEVRLEGDVAEQGSLVLEGTIGALGQNDTSVLDLVGDNIAIPPLTPYVARYLGYKVESGRLALDLDYTIVGDQLDGSNDVVLHDFRLGENVDSPQAVDAPVQLGLALLRDRSGTISVELPVNGSLSDPSFNFSEVILSTFSGLVARAATAPFSLLGNLVNIGGSDEDLGNTGFAPGSAELPAKENEELQALTEALNERPAISLQFRGVSAPDWDGPALVLAERGVSLPAEGLGPLIDKLESLLVELEGESALESQVRARDTDAGPRRSSPEWAQTLLRQLVGEESPEPGALRQLAEDRAAAIERALVDNGIDPGRLSREAVRTSGEVEQGRVMVPLEPGSR
ncbi:DUF748 domain-containing protein [Hydrocarboniclastica marina]|uniref:DUF748 domain-containing protein n=1 Tax=Hydrocarboniclastica marina TaxID=2259620 RepID=A0A4P7XCH9_9ALTE|nr:DUF748 domain-containing protein [Hydrocarboniclastica marina]